MNVKFKIQQKRDKFRILKFEKTKVVTYRQECRSSLFGLLKKHKDPHYTGIEYEWSEGELVCKRPEEMDQRELDKWTKSLGSYTVAKLFNSHEEANEYIFQEYGWNGWEAIQEPEWKTV